MADEPASKRQDTPVGREFPVLQALYRVEHAAHYLEVSRVMIFVWLKQRCMFSRAELDGFAAELESDGQ